MSGDRVLRLLEEGRGGGEPDERREPPNARAIALMDLGPLLAPHERRAFDEQMAWEAWVERHAGSLEELWQRRDAALAALEERDLLTPELSDLLAQTQDRIAELMPDEGE